MKSVVLAAILVAGAASLAGTGQSPTDRSEDLRILDESFVRVEAAFDAASRARAAEALQALRARANGMSAAEFELAVAEIGAMTENGHSGLARGTWPRRFNRLTAQFITFDDGLYVFDESSQIDGARVLSIDDAGLDALRRAWARYAPGPGRDDYLGTFLRSPELLHAAGIARSPESVTLTLEQPDGTRVTRRMAALPPLTTPPAPSRAPELAVAPAGLRPENTPLYRQEPDAAIRYVDLPGRDAVYVQFRRNSNWDDPKAFQQQIDEIRDRLENRRPRYVIVDQRFNSGGDLNTTRELMKRIPGALAPGGRVFAITSGRTFSAGIASVAYLKQAAGTRLTIVGRPAGDDLDFWAESGTITLPVSGIRMSVSSERHNYTNGCPGPECHAPIRANPIAIPSIEPDIRPVFSGKDFLAGRDPFMDAIFRELGSQPGAVSDGQAAAPAPAAVAVPDTPAGRGLQEFVASFNAGGDARKAWLRDRTTMDAKVAANVLEQDIALLASMGPMVIVRLPEGSPSQTTIVAIVRHEKAGVHGQVTIEVEAAAPHRIVNIQLRGAKG